jgi:hypothetical protein
MRRFVCPVCHTQISFTSSECGSCATALGFFSDGLELLPLAVAPSAAAGYVVLARTQDESVWWRCLNFAWGCNWMIRADSGDVWCSACRLTRGRPDESSLDAVLAWSTTELAKRRLIYQLRSLGLPIDSPADDPDNGVVFDLVYLPDSRGVTGHRKGVVTFDLREVDDRFREGARLAFYEPDRTVLGHLRHEIGHHYWDLLVVRNDAVDEFRDLFGDERPDYNEALEQHYERLGEAFPDTHITSYATSHPSEDWAEMFAHFLHIRDGIETADEFGLDHPATKPEALDALLDRWAVLANALNEMSLGLGHSAPYPYTISAAVATKLAFVQRQVARATNNR